MRATGSIRTAAGLVGLAFAASLSACGGSDVPTWSISGTVSGAVSQGVTVTLGGASNATATTDASGHYAFPGLADGGYTVIPSLEGYLFDPAIRSVSLSGADVGEQDFVASAVPHAISGTVSGAVSQGVTVTLGGASSATTITDASGHYAFSRLADGSYTVTPSLAGHEFDPATRSVTLNGADAGDQDFTAWVPHAISGSVSGAVSEGVTVALEGAGSAATTTDASGHYAFPGLADGSYTVTPSLAGHEFDPATRSVTLNGAGAGDQDFTAWVPHAISGSVSGAVSQGVNVALTGASSATTTTDASGHYAFEGLSDGSYTVTLSLAGYAFDPPSRPISLNGADAGGQDFVASLAPYVISGTVSGEVSRGVTVTLGGASSATTTTDASGHYAFSGLADGSYSVTPSLSRYTFDPAIRWVSLGGADAGGQDFAAAQVRGTFVATGRMIAARAGHTATRLPDGKALVAGGYSYSVSPVRCSPCPPSPRPSPFCRPCPLPTWVPLRGAERYDPATGTFKATGGMTAARAWHTATFLLNGRVLVAGGRTAPFGSSSTATAELYDPAVGTFTATGSMTVARGSHTATLLPNGLVLVAGGSTATAELYDPAIGTFTATGSMTAARSSHTATLLPNGLVLVTGGSTATAELYDPATGTFTATGSMTVARSSHTATLLPSGVVLVAGGSTATAELYDPATGTFTATGSMTVTRSSHTATLLPNGTVLVAGGGVTAELYNPAAGAFTATGSMTLAHRSHTAMLLPTGRVLVAGGGGVTPFTPTTATAELYSP